MCGKAFDPRLIVAWPSAEMVAGQALAAKVLMQLNRVHQKKGVEISGKEQAAL